MARFGGVCSRCGRVYYEDHKVLMVCDCWEKCPLCGAMMEAFTPDLAAITYAKSGKCELLILRVCNNAAAHSDGSPFFSCQKPVEVELT